MAYATTAALATEAKSRREEDAKIRADAAALALRVAALEAQMSNVKLRITKIEGTVTPPVPPTPEPTPPTRPWAAPVTTQTVTVPSSIDHTGATNTGPALNNFLASVPDHSIVNFAIPGAIYRLDVGMALDGHHHLVFEGNGSTTLRGTGNPASMWADPFVTYSSPTSLTDIAIQNFIIVGSNPHTGNDLYTPGSEDMMGVGIYGGTRIEIAHNNISHTWGEAVYLGPGPNNTVANYVWIHHNACDYLGRQGFANCGGTNVTIEDNTMDHVAGTPCDIEPWSNSVNLPCDNMTFRRNTIGWWGMTTVGCGFFFSSGNQTQGILSSIDNLTVSDNIVTHGPYPGGASVGKGGLHTIIGHPHGYHNVRFTGNFTSVAHTSQVEWPGSCWNFWHIDGLTVTGNTQPIGGSGVLFDLQDVTNAVTSPNP